MSVDIARMQILLNRVHPYQDAMEKPFQIDGWLIATCGHAMIGVRSTEGKPWDGNSKTPQSALEILSVPLGEAYLPISALRAVVKGPAERAPCFKCGSVGRIDCPRCEGEGTVDCECKCGNEHERSCQACGGKGGSVCGCGWSPRQKCKSFVRIDAGTYDAELLGEYLYPVTAEAFQFNQPTATGPWVFGGDEWRIAIMPVRAEKAELESATTLTLKREGVTA